MGELLYRGRETDPAQERGDKTQSEPGARCAPGWVAEPQFTAAGIDCRPHTIRGALAWHYFIGQPVDQLVGILNTGLTEAESGADLEAVTPAWLARCITTAAGTSCCRRENGLRGGRR